MAVIVMPCRVEEGEPVYLENGQMTPQVRYRVEYDMSGVPRHFEVITGSETRTMLKQEDGLSDDQIKDFIHKALCDFVLEHMSTPGAPSEGGIIRLVMPAEFLSERRKKLKK
jgi:hypothetical protein